MPTLKVKRYSDGIAGRRSEPGLWMTDDGRFCVFRPFGRTGRRERALGDWRLAPMDTIGTGPEERFLRRHGLASAEFTTRAAALRALEAALALDAGDLIDGGPFLVFDTGKGWGVTGATGDACAFMRDFAAPLTNNQGFHTRAQAEAAARALKQLYEVTSSAVQLDVRGPR